MNIKHIDLTENIDKENPFAECKLGRQQYAEILTKIVETYADGFVLAINNEWGTGKTTFVKMWQQFLENRDFKTLYFNAWENDFDHNPLPAIMAELKSLNKTKDAFKSVLEKGAILTKHTVPALVKSAVKKFSGVDCDEIVGSLVDGTTEILSEEIKQYTQKKETVAEFHKALATYIEKTTKGTDETTTQKPLVFFIDELDRCRPSYAVEVLEQIKHLFSVEGIVFVLSIDKEQLKHAVCGVYGSEQINANEYLRRFIDLEYSIPQPKTKQFVDYLVDYFSFQDFFKNRFDDKFRNDYNNFSTIVLFLFEKYNLTLRQQEKILGFMRLNLQTFDAGEFLPAVFFFLIFIKIREPLFYKQIQNYSLSPQELCNEFAETMGKQKEKSVNCIWLEATLLYFYHNDLSYNASSSGLQIDPLVEINENKVPVTKIQSKYGTDGKNLANYLNILTHQYDNYHGYRVSCLIQHIDLLQNLNQEL